MGQTVKIDTESPHEMRSEATFRARIRSIRIHDRNKRTGLFQSKRAIMTQLLADSLKLPRRIGADNDRMEPG